MSTDATPAPDPAAPAARPFWKSERLWGVVFCLLGAALAVISVYIPLRDAAAGAPEVSVSMKAAALVPVLTGLGLLYMLMGARAETLIGARRAGGRMTLAGWVIVIALVAAGIGLYAWLEASMRAQGYIFE